MSSKSWPTFATPRAVGVSKYLERHTEPWSFRIEDRTSDGRIKSSKRKDGSTERLEKASKTRKDSESPTPGPSHVFFEKSASRKKSSKQKNSDGTKEPRSKKRRTSSSQEESNNSIYETDDPLPSTYNGHTTEDFEEKYDEQDMLGEGQYGEVFFGKRREDNFPVWLLMCALYACFLVVHPVLYVLFLKHIFSLMQVVIKHVPQKLLYRQPMLLNGRMTKIPLEVALLIKVGAGPEATSSNVTPVLLDWYDLEKELIMVFEGGKNNIDLDVYLSNRRERICESDIKAIMRQLVDAATEMHSKGVFHQDIKTDNIIIENSAERLAHRRVKYIDFGCGVFFTPEAVTRRNGRKSPALNLLFNATKADCITVLQLGRVMDRLLHNITSSKNMYSKRTDISENCESFLLGCLAANNEDRLTLEELRNHPWFK
ncbi:serine/threonine-protein kinase pim-2-like isoform X1 [Simochromis diagramma]|uniref:serine/threonine-protein kinase pim-2-like isoform X1 n=1 Tax=Simochromis diagramma TaxID=43689 RepID=UPI001A7E208D|nr:serine/threonine-protein kinase pim-2-like isoform X1 [Simochromis diagramma]XP_039901640.1 serine/threonine-protein kinase pim-2-like isoform X1 [Simochromis diagramma]